MSLIHEALKRAEADKNRASDPTSADPLKPRAAGPNPRPVKVHTIVVLAIAVILVVTGAVMFLLYYGANLPQSVWAQGKAKPDATHQPTTSQAKSGSPASGTPQAESPKADGKQAPANASRTTAVARQTPNALDHQGGAKTTGTQHFKVSGIMSGPNGQAALINGRMVQVGQIIDGARLVAISPNAVQLVMADRELTVDLEP